MDELVCGLKISYPRLPHPKIGWLTGSCAFPVNRIKELHKVTVRIPPDNEKSNLIRIEGDPQGVQEAKKELLELASRMVSRNPIECRHSGSPTGAPLNTLSPPAGERAYKGPDHRTAFSQSNHRPKRGKDQRSARQIPRGQSGRLHVCLKINIPVCWTNTVVLFCFQVIINFPDPAQKSDIVQLRGPRNEVEKCAKFMQKIVAEMVNVVSLDFQVPLWWVCLCVLTSRNICPGGEQLLRLSPHLQAVPQEHHRERRIEHQEGAASFPRSKSSSFDVEFFFF